MIYLQYTYSRLKNTNFVINNNKDGRNRFLYLISCSLPKPKFSLWFTDIIYKHILSLNRMTGDKQIGTLLGFS